MHQRISAKAPVLFALHLACPRPLFTDKGKTKLALPPEVAAQLIDAVTRVTKQWAKIIKAEERKASAKARREEYLSRKRKVFATVAARDIMEEAYMKASDNDRLPAKARQIMYVARPYIQERTGKQLNDNYFTQTLLPNYIAENDHATDWKVVYDDRGHFREPYTNHVIGLGTLPVRQYLSEIGEPKLQQAGFAPPRIVTRGPHGCYGAVLFVEKEGFDALWVAVELAERYGLAIESTKGMSVTACRELADKMCSQYNIPLFVLHDFDKSGFSIVGTLRDNTRRYTYRNQITVIDFGLRLTDIAGLESEDVYDDDSEDARRANMLQNGATPEEVEFLLHRRVELNAMPSRQLVDLVERKLQEHGVRRIIPNETELADAYRLFAHGREAQEVIARELAKLNGGSPVSVPDDLRKRVARYLAEHPTARWDEAVAAILG
jgi:hypothetical protein